MKKRNYIRKPSKETVNLPRYRWGNLKVGDYVWIEGAGFHAEGRIVDKRDNGIYINMTSPIENVYNAVWFYFIDIIEVLYEPDDTVKESCVEAPFLWCVDGGQAVIGDTIEVCFTPTSMLDGKIASGVLIGIDSEHFAIRTNNNCYRVFVKSNDIFVFKIKHESAVTQDKTDAVFVTKMSTETFQKLLDELDGNSLQTLKEKNARYSIDGDALHNFRSGAEVAGGTPAQACWGYMTKHLVALRDMVDKDDFSNRDDFLEKCQDTINYIRFLWCIGNEENQNKKESN